MKKNYKDPSLLPVGFDQNGEAVYIDMNKNNSLTVLSEKRNALAHYIDELSGMLAGSGDNELHIFGDAMKGSEDAAGTIKRIYPASYEKAVMDIAVILENRRLRMNMCGLMGDESKDADEKRLCVIVDNISAFSSNLSDKSKKIMHNIIINSKGLNIFIMTAGARDELTMMSAEDMVLSAVKESDNEMIINSEPYSFAFFNSDLAEISKASGSDERQAYLLSSDRNGWILLDREE